MSGRAPFAFTMRGIILALVLTLVGKATYPSFTFLSQIFLKFSGSGRLSEVLLHLDVHKPMVLPTRHSRRLRGLAGAAARLPKSNQQLLMSDILQEPVLHRRKGGRSRKCFMLAGMVGALEDSPASQEKLDKLQKCVDRNIMGSARS